MTERDEAWSATHRESMDELAARVTNFLQSLAQRSENNILVVSHGVFIEVCLNRFCPAALGYGSRRVYNCDMFAGECVSFQGRFLRLQHFRQIR
jgi:broad specificity phosphatase PhoE